jgi:hypothetical protein
MVKFVWITKVMQSGIEVFQCQLISYPVNKKLVIKKMWSEEWRRWRRVKVVVVPCKSRKQVGRMLKLEFGWFCCCGFGISSEFNRFCRKVRLRRWLLSSCCCNWVGRRSRKWWWMAPKSHTKCKLLLLMISPFFFRSQC